MIYETRHETKEKKDLLDRISDTVYLNIPQKRKKGCSVS